ncbi:MAG: Brp/Blh family beta-carotene 15,15'-dioxygenase [Xanthomonadales bacterium]|nr:Brp/Blh family beta-carotene 15,15'-dioxygenase [Xanthomonadales bacterium]
MIFGLPHGALDPLVARAAGRWRTQRELVEHLLAYVGLAAAVVIAWLALPLPVLAAFLLLSVWHFSGDWPKLPDGRQAKAFHRLALGWVVVASPLLFHPERVTELFSVLTGRPQDDAMQAALVAVLGWLSLPALAVVSVNILRGLRRDIQGSLELASLPLLAWLLPPLLYFLFYFCFLHSPRHLLGLAADARIREHRWFWLALVGLTLAAVCLLMTGYALIDGRPSERVIQVVFIGLAALTVPHMILVERFERSR